MAGWKHFREIAAWQHARELKLLVYTLLNRPEIKRSYKLCDQLSDSARSGPSNIAEGFGKFGNKEFARYARISKGSELEVWNHLIDLNDLKLITDDELVAAETQCLKAVGATTGLIQHLETTPDPPRPKPRKKEPKKPRKPTSGGTNETDNPELPNPEPENF